MHIGKAQPSGNLNIRTTITFSCKQFKQCLVNTPSTFITLTFWFGGGRLGSYDQGTVLHDCPAKRWI
jgi:hypothetical protein